MKKVYLFLLISLLFGCSSVKKIENQINLDYTQEDVAKNEFETIRKLKSSEPTKALWRSYLLENKDILQECIDHFLIQLDLSIEEKDYFEDINLTQQEFYEMLEGGDDISTSQPSPETVMNMWKELLKEYDEKYYLMFRIGINAGIRVSDILTLKVSDVREKDHITIIEKKTGKTKRFLLPNTLKKEIGKFIYENNMGDDEFLIQSRKGTNQPISRIQAYRVLRETGEQIGLEEVGTHTMRKTFGYHHYQANKDVAILQEIFNHAAPSICMRYIGITDDMKDNSLKDFDSELI